MEESTSASDRVPFANAPAVSQAVEQLQEELAGLQAAIEHIEESKDAAQRAAEAATAVSTSAEDLATASAGLVKRIEAIDFPERFDRLDKGSQRILDATSEILEANATTQSAVEEGLSDIHRKVRTDLGNVQSAIQRDVAELEDSASKQISSLESRIDTLQTRVLSAVGGGFAILLILMGMILV